MPVTALDAQSALLLIDLQKGIALPTCVHPIAEVLQHAALLAESFRQRQWPVIIVNVGFLPDRQDLLSPRTDFTLKMDLKEGWDQIVPEIPVKPGDIRLTKRGWNAFYGTELDLQLRRRHVTGIILAGIRTSVGVEGTARAAYERGYNLTFASDATSDYDQAAHDHSFTKIFHRIGEIDTTKAIIDRI